MTYTIAPEVAGSLVNTALAAGQTADPAVNNNVAQATVVVEDPPTPTPSPTHTPTSDGDAAAERDHAAPVGAGQRGRGRVRARACGLNGTLGQSSPIGGTGTGEPDRGRLCASTAPAAISSAPAPWAALLSSLQAAVLIICVRLKRRIGTY